MQDTQQIIYTFLSLTDIITCSYVNKFFYKCTKQQIIWKSFIARDFKKDIVFRINQYETYKYCYKLTKLKKGIYYYGSIQNLLSLKKYEVPHGAGIPHPINLHNISELQQLETFGIRYHTQPLIIPPEIGQMQNLKDIYFENNKYVQLPTNLGQLSNLYKLHLSGNKQINIPTQIGQLSNLHELWISSTNQVNIPSEIGQLQNLNSLTLHNNNLTSLPKEIENLTNLHTLYMPNNQLTYLPFIIKNMPKLINITI